VLSLLPREAVCARGCRYVKRWPQTREGKGEVGRGWPLENDQLLVRAALTMGLRLSGVYGHWNLSIGSLLGRDVEAKIALNKPV